MQSKLRTAIPEFRHRSGLRKERHYDSGICHRHQRERRTPGSGQSLVHQCLTPSGDTYWVQMQNAPTALSGTNVTINDTAPTGDRYNLTIVEVRTP